MKIIEKSINPSEGAKQIHNYDLKGTQLFNNDVDAYTQIVTVIRSDDAEDVDKNYIKEQLKRLKTFEKKVEDTLLAHDFVGAAQAWVNENGQVRGSEAVLQDGSTVQVPITDKEFLEALRLEHLSIEDTNAGDPVYYLYLTTEPDFFMGNTIEVTIMGEGDVRTKLVF